MSKDKKYKKIFKLITKIYGNDIINHPDFENIFNSFLKVYRWKKENNKWIKNNNINEEIKNEYIYDLSFDDDIDNDINNSDHIHKNHVNDYYYNNASLSIKKDEIELFKKWIHYSSNHPLGEREKIKQYLNSTIFNNKNLYDINNYNYQNDNTNNSAHISEKIQLENSLNNLSDCYDISPLFIIFVLKNPHQYDLSLNDKIKIFKKIKKHIPQ